MLSGGKANNSEKGGITSQSVAIANAMHKKQSRCPWKTGAVPSEPAEKIQLLWRADHSRCFDHSRLFRLVAVIGRKHADLLDDFKAGSICGPAENRILSVERGLCSQANEELATR